MKVAVAMSGGVDSAVTALLLKEMGYEVVGVHFKTEMDEFFLKYHLTHKVCCSPEDTKDVKEVAKKLDIELHIMDLHKEFKKEIIEDFIEGYRSGLTPNPCVKCNKKIKFSFLHKFAKAIGAELWATGHYAKAKNGRIFVAKDEKKDQSYFLALVKKDDLKGLTLPLGEYKKDEVRKIANENKLTVSKKPDSQDVCFIPDGNIEHFFNKNGILLKEGLVLDTKGRVVGRHRGYQLYTIGQRKGLGVAVGERVYVVNIIPSKNIIVVGKKEELLTKYISVGNMNLQVELPLEMEAECKVRSTAPRIPCHVKFGKVTIVELSKQVVAVPGQLLALYEKNALLGGGIILQKQE